MASHGDKDNLNSFTLLNKDYERVIAHHIQKNNQLEGKLFNHDKMYAIHKGVKMM
jgi:hypothetical protein